MDSKTKRQKGPRALRSCVPVELLAQLARQLDQSSQLQALWAITIDESMARHSNPVSYDQGCITVETPTSAWASRLRMCQAQVVKQLRQHPSLRGLHRLKIHVRPTTRALPPLAVQSASSVLKPTALSSHNARLLRRVAASIDDPELRQALERLSKHAAQD
jgi:hypothetical protein